MQYIPTRLKFLSISLCLVVGNAMSQSLADTLQTGSYVKEIGSQFLVESENRNGPYEYVYCDLDGDGFMELDIATIEAEVLGGEGLEENDEEAILISTSNGQIVKVNYPFSNANIEDTCANQLSLIGKSDVAVDENGEVYGCTFATIFRLDADTCTQENLIEFSFGSIVNSLSFDTNGNLYYGFSDTSEIMRYDADQLTQPYVWHDFGSGGAGGDFVMLGGKLYISWIFDSTYKLFEVTVDANINYVSHVDLVDLPSNTYGLASEFGKLYGVTPTGLFQIDLDTLDFVTVLQNDGTYGDWWGAAGLHEAIEFEVNTYESMNDATSQLNAIPDSWINTQFEGQVIYVRIDNLTEGTYDIFPVTISIGRVPQINQPANLYRCSNDPNSIVELSDVEDDILVNPNENVDFTYYLSADDRLNENNAIDTQYTDLTSRVIFVLVKSATSDCFAWTSFEVVYYDAPSLKPIVNSASERMISECFINNLEQGYFDLTHMYEEVALEPNPNDTIQFFASLSDAENDVFALSTNYISTVGVVEELFIKVTNELGCSEITNFFIDGDCVLTTTDLSNLFFPKYFTPNDDGFHDYWNVKGISQLMREKSEISIFNRYGKFLFKFRPSQVRGWDGIYDSSNLAPDDYWFKMTVFNGKEYTGHFTLKR